jgi:hypothetical protein
MHMKTGRSSLPAFLLLFLVIALHPPSAAAFTPFPKAEGIDVVSVASDPYAFKGEIKIRGAVMDADPGKKLFNVIDYREYRSCRVVNCAIKWVTILYNGRLPAVASVVEVTGVIQENTAGKGGYVLRAKAVTVK